SNDESTFLDGLREAVSYAPKGNSTGAGAMREAIRIRSGQRNVKLYEPRLSVRAWRNIGEARSRLLHLAEKQSLLKDPYESGNLITAFVSLSDSHEQQKLVEEIFDVGGTEQGYVFQLLFNQMRATAVLSAGRKA
ncbi:hypothetical protein, partial [Anaerobaca lacustris]|nr:hypothetical protein [Sedimentisphaerales bacterium M17dextr]